MAVKGDEMNLDKYFELPHTPSAFSPVGKLMRRILEESPDISFQDARNLAKEQLLKAGGRRKYQVFTPKQDAKRAARFNAIPETAKSAYPTKEL
jgi:hypothetical protein